MSEQLAINLKEKRKALGLNQKELAKKAGCSQTTISDIERGRNSGSKELPGIAKALKTTVEALLGKTAQASVNPKGPIESGSDRVPLISWVQACDSESEQELTPLNGKFLICPVPHSPDTYALKVYGDAMTSPVGRSYPEDSIIYVDPRDKDSVKSGDRVVANLNGQRATFRQLAFDGDQPYLKALSPGHPPIFEDFEIVGKVIGMWMDD